MANVSRPLIGLLVATVVFFALWIVALKPSASGTSANGAQGLGPYQSAVNQARASAATQNRAAAAANATTATTGSSAAGAAGAATTASAAHATPAAKSTAPSAATSTATAAKTVNHTHVHAASAVTTVHHARVHRAAHHARTADHARTAHHARAHATAAATAKTAHRTAGVHAATPTQRRDVVERALAKHKVLALLVYNPAAADDQAVKRELATIPNSRGRVVKLAIPVREVTNYPVISSQVQITSSPTLVIIDSSAQAFTLVGFADRFEIVRRIGDALSMH